MSALIDDGVSFIVERANGTPQSAVDVLSSKVYTSMRASLEHCGSIDHGRLLEYLRAGKRERYEINECPLGFTQLAGLLRGENDPFWLLAQESQLLQVLWVAHGDMQSSGALVAGTDGISSCQLVAFTAPPGSATPIHVDHQSFGPDGACAPCSAFPEWDVPFVIRTEHSQQHSQQQRILNPAHSLQPPLC